MVATRYFNGKRYSLTTSTITRGVAVELTKREADRVIASKRARGYLARKVVEPGGYSVYVRKK